MENMISTFSNCAFPSNIFLDTSSNSTLFAWLNSTDFSGNIYVTDSDSTIDFSSLYALSRNTSGNYSSADFETLDLYLNLTNVTDSINRTYTVDGFDNFTTNFTIFSSNITFVPLVNTTNSSNFVTGILWDSSDSTIGFYNGTQDVIFATKINKNSLGFYGTYDFEIKIPANLRQYISPNMQNMVSFYREVT